MTDAPRLSRTIQSDERPTITPDSALVFQHIQNAGVALLVSHWVPREPAQHDSPWRFGNIRLIWKEPNCFAKYFSGRSPPHNDHGLFLRLGLDCGGKLRATLSCRVEQFEPRLSLFHCLDYKNSKPAASTGTGAEGGGGGGVCYGRAVCGILQLSRSRKVKTLLRNPCPLNGQMQE